MYHWRAEQPGPEIAARDPARAVAEGTAGYYQDEAGVLLPPGPSVIGLVRRPGAREA